MVTSKSDHDPNAPSGEPHPGPGAGPQAPRRSTTIAGLPVGYFLAASAIVAAAAADDRLPDLLITGFAVTMLIGGLLTWVGGLVPVVRDFGLATILCLFAPAVLVFTGLVPEPLTALITDFVDGVGFLDFFVVAVISGSILGMPRTVLLKAGPRFVLPLVVCISTTLVVTGAIGQAVGYGFREAVFYVAGPTMGGGLGLGAIPMSEMYASEFGGGSGAYMPTLMSAVLLANALCILIAGIYNGVGKRRQLFVGFDGRGQLLRFKEDERLPVPRATTEGTFTAFGQGLLIACVLFTAGSALSGLFPVVHAYAWTIVLAAVIKVFGLLPQHLEEASSSWSDFVTSVWLPGLLVGVSFAYVDIGEVLTAVKDPRLALLILSAVLLSALTAGTVGWLVRMHFVEASITPGLAMADSGGSGDVAVLSAAERMHLMPFAQLSTRIGGMFTLLVISLLVSVMPAAAPP